VLKKSLKNIFTYSKIGLRLSIYAVCTSFIFAFISIAILIYIDSEKTKKDVVNSTEQAINTIEDQLAKELWDVDNEGITITLKGLERLSFIEGVKVFCHVGKDIEVGNISDPVDVTRSITFNGEELGILTVNYNKNDITQSLYQKYKTMSFSILFIIGLMGAIFYIIVNLSLIRHIAYISDFRKLSSLNNSTEYQPLKLIRNKRNDELSDLVEVLNEGKKKAIELLQAKKEYQEQMEYQANFDLLTGLPNRRHLYGYLSTQIKNYEPELGNLVVMFVDLDGFKQVNDSMGHSVGDKVLQICAVRLLNASKNLNGYISRLGGDEFILCFYSAPCDSYEKPSKQVIDVFSEKINARGIQVKLGCSIGIAVYPDGPFDDPKQLIRNADNALYRAKDSGRNTFFCFDDVIRNELIFEQKVHDKLMDAIEAGVFKINYQPLVDIQSNQVIGFEALLRWHDPELGWIRPDIFISVAEKMGVVFDLDSWVFEKAIAQVDLWRKAFDTPFIISINFSPTNFYHGNFSSWLSDSPSF